MVSTVDLDELSRRESEQVEWKENVADIDDVVETLAAFANDLANLGGGYVVCGAREAKDEHGFPFLIRQGLSADRLRALEGTVLTRCRERVSPPITPRVEEQPGATPENRILVFIQPATNQAHTFRRRDQGGKYFVRVGRATIEARNGVFRDLLVRKGTLEPWDRRPCHGATVNDLDLLALRDALQRMKIFSPARGVEPYLDPEVQISPFVPPLCWFEPLTATVRPRNFAVLLFGQETQRFIPGAFSLFSIYPGVDRSAPHAERHELAGNLVEQARRLTELLEAQSYTAFDKNDPTSPNALKYPPDALKEAMGNALAHRDYELDDPTRITAFADRIEIVSPGTLPLGVDPVAFREGRAGPRWRNQALAWFFNRLQYAQAEGQGMSTILRTMEDEGCPPPTFSADEVRVLYLLPAHPRHARFASATSAAWIRREDTVLAAAEATYRRYLVNRWSFLSFRGMGVARAPGMPLLELYTPLHAQLERPGGDEPEGDLIAAPRKSPGSASREERRSLLALLAEGPGFVLLGHPGSGKSTFLQFVALMLAQDRGEELGLPAGGLPVLVSLAEYAAAIRTESGPVPTLAEFFLRRTGELLGEELPMAALLRREERAGRLVWLLDGLDEARGVAEQLAVVRQLEGLLAARGESRNRFVITSRIVGYDRVRLARGALHECRLAPLSHEEIDVFVTRWTHLVERTLSGEGQATARAAAREREGLLRVIAGNARIAELAANPLLLTILVLMKRQGVELPERRVLLYQNYVTTLLSHWPLARSPAAGAPREAGELRRILDPLALWMQASGRVAVEEEALRRFLAQCFEATSEDPGRESVAFLEEVRETTSLLVERGPGEYGFLHLVFQEFLAAAALASEREEPAESTIMRYAGQPEWHEVIPLTIGCLAVIQMRERVAGEVLHALLRERPGEPGQAVVLAGRSLVDAGARAIPPAVSAEVVEALLQSLVDDNQVASKLRAAAGTALAALGDPRPEATTIEGLWEALRTVEAGAFWMGSDPARHQPSYENEAPYHQVDLPYTFRMSRYPVTVGQFRQYLLASGEQPGDPGSLFDLANEPVRLVSWDEALAFCRWLTARWRENGRLSPKESVFLPSEAEWEKAARGQDGRVFPWGGEEDSNRMNHRMSIGTPSAVGCFPGGASPYGCEEMTGNVFEWTRSLFRPYPYDAGDGREDLASRASRIARGGAFGDSPDFARTAARYDLDPASRLGYLGFRIVVLPASSAL